MAVSDAALCLHMCFPALLLFVECSALPLFPPKRAEINRKRASTKSNLLGM